MLIHIFNFILYFIHKTDWRMIKRIIITKTFLIKRIIFTKTFLINFIKIFKENREQLILNIK